MKTTLTCRQCQKEFEANVDGKKPREFCDDCRKSHKDQIQRLYRKRIVGYCEVCRGPIKREGIKSHASCLANRDYKKVTESEFKAVNNAPAYDNECVFV